LRRGRITRANRSDAHVRTALNLANHHTNCRLSTTVRLCDRSEAAFTIDITLNAGRTTELKTQFYVTLAERLNTQAGIRPRDVLIVLTEVSNENWWFGNGQAQYA
jgi:4-oxalocrotonate tautomerase